MKTKIVIIAVLSTLVIGSIYAGAININTQKTAEDDAVKAEQTVMEIADLIIDSKNTEATIDLKDLVLDLTIPDHETIMPVELKFNCKIENEKLLNTETWVFIVEMRKYPAGAFLINEEITKEDTVIEGYPWEKTISTTVDFSRDYPWERRGATDVFEQRYSLRVRCEYYDDGVKPGEQSPDDHASEYKNPVVILDNHNPPTKPTLTGDIENGETGSIDETYTFTAYGSTDPEGDEVDHYDFDFHDGTVETVFPDEEGKVTASHKWPEYKEGENRVSVYSFDSFGFMSDGAELIFTLPKEKSLVKNKLSLIMEKFPFLATLLDNLF